MLLPSPSSSCPLPRTTTGPHMLCRSSLGSPVPGCSRVLQTDPGNPRARCVPIASSAGGQSTSNTPPPPASSSPCPQALVTIYSAPAPDEHGDGSIFSDVQKVPIYLGAPILSSPPGVGRLAPGGSLCIAARMKTWARRG